MPIITLTTDFGIKDHYVAAAKGMLLQKNPDAQLIDVSHCIDLYHIGNASYVLFGAYKHFPEKTVHIVSVDAELYDQSYFLLMVYDGHYFLSADNGALSLLVANNQPDWLFRLHISSGITSSMALFADVISKMETQPLTALGDEITMEDCVQLTEMKPQVIDEGNAIRGSFIYEDHYGNAITNVSKSLFEKIGKGRAFDFMASRYTLSRINAFYSDFNTEVKPLGDFVSQALLLFNSDHFLQLSIYKGNIQQSGTVKSLLGLGYRDTFIIQFK